MHPVVMIPIDLYQWPEFTKLQQCSRSGQYKSILAFWNDLLFKAARLNQGGLLFAEPEQPLTLRTIAKWTGFSHTERVPPLLDLLLDCGLLEATANQQYRISHWDSFAVVNCENHHGLVKFYRPDRPPQKIVQSPASPPTTITPLALQKYTPVQRAKLATTTGKILAYLHQQSGKQFSNEPATQILLAGLFDQKVTIKQIKQVIDWKCKDWYETDFWKFVRPQTLFGPKFKQYLLEAPPPAHVQPAAQLTRTQYLRDLYQLSCGDVAMVLRRAADEEVAVTEEEVEAIGRDLGY